MSDIRIMGRSVMAVTLSVMIQASLVLALFFVGQPMTAAAQTVLPPMPLIRDARFDARPLNAGLTLNKTRPFDMIRQGDKRLVAGTSCPIPYTDRCSNILLARYLPTGELDPAFGENGIIQFNDLLQLYPTFSTIHVDGFLGLFGLSQQRAGKTIVGWHGGLYGVSLEMARFGEDGKPDLSFGVGGILTDTSVFWPSALAVQADDKIVVGSNWVQSGNYYFQLNRYTADGRPDDSFGDHGVVRSLNLHIPNQVLIQPDQKIVAVTGRYSGDAWSSRIIRILPDGQIDLGFGNNGIVEDTCPPPCDFPSPFKLLQVDSHLYRLVARYTPNGYDNLILQRFKDDGSIDPTLGANGQISLVTPTNASGFTDFQVMPDQRLVIFTKPSYINRASTVIAARYWPTGTLDTSFGHNSVLEQNFGDERSDIARTDLDAAGWLTLLGSSESIYGTSGTIVIVQLNPDGTFDPSYGKQGMARLALQGPSSETLTGQLLFQPDRKVIAIAQNQYSENGDKPYFHMVRYSPDGSPDATFGNQGILLMTAAGQPMQVADAVLQPDGAIVAAGSLNNDAVLVRYLPSGQPDLTFGVSGTITASGSLSLPVSFVKVEIQSGGQLLSQMDDDTQSYLRVTPTSVLMRFTPTGERDLSFGAQGLYTGTKQIIDFQLMPNQSIVVLHWQHPDRVLTLTALDQAGHLDPGFGDQGILTYPTPELAIGFCNWFKLIPQDDSLLIDTGFAYAGDRGGVCDYVLLRVTHEGVRDTSFGTDGSLSIPYRLNSNGIAATGQGIYILEDWRHCGLPGDECLTPYNFLWFYAPDGNPNSKTRVWFTDRGQLWPGFATGIAIQPDDPRHGIFVAQQVSSRDSTDVNVTHLVSATYAVPMPAVFR